MRTREERLAACLVDGPRRHRTRPFSAGQIIEAAEVIAAALDRNHWRSWARMVRRSTVAGHDPHLPPIEATGQALEAVRVFGPFGAAALYDDFARDALDDLDVLIVSSGQYWPPGGDVWP